jgi:uncharacterized protein YdhG (YjbR/CyaY superfamily)
MILVRGQIRWIVNEITERNTNCRRIHREFPEAPPNQIESFRKTVRRTAPKATESISYRIPAYHFQGPLVYFAAFKSHIGFYPRPSGIIKFRKELAVYKRAKGSVQFPTNQPLPLALIAKIIRFRLGENKQLALQKKV